MNRADEKFEWTNAAIATLCRLWGEGHSASEIGRRMGISKNAVVGKAHRLDSGCSADTDPDTRPLQAEAGAPAESVQIKPPQPPIARRRRAVADDRDRRAALH